LVICLDSGCGNYDQLWLATSLRGLTSGILTVRVLEEGVHSGDASGIVPSSFRVLRLLLSRLEDEGTGAIRPSELYAQIPPERVTQARRAAAALGSAVYTKFPFPAGMSPVTEDLTELVLNRTWRPQLAVTGIDGLPKPADAGNVLLPYTTTKLSLRLPPTLDTAAAGPALRALPEKSSPSERRPPTWEKAAASRSWRCSARNSRMRSLSSPVCSDRIPMRMAQTSSCTSRLPGEFRW